jgi:tetratricopeptide (TPR) repeat protein
VPVLLALCPLARAHDPLHEQIAGATRRIAMAPADPAPLVERADLLRLDGQCAEAAQDLERAAALDPSLPGLDVRRGLLALACGDAALAAATLDRHLASAPHDGDALLVRARARAMLGRRAEALADYERALTELPRPTPDLYLEAARLAVADGDPERALARLDDAAARLGRTPALENFAISLQRSLGRDAAALERELGLAAAHADPGGAQGSPRAAGPVPVTAPLAVNASLFARASAWRYLATPTDPGTSWRDPAYDDSSWPSATAPLGYGDPFIAGTIPYGSDPANKWRTAYFRAAFAGSSLPPGLQSLVATVNYDDGFVLYLNGTEVARRSMPAGPVSYATFATNHEGGAYEVVDLSGSIGLLVGGTNVLAAEVHQATAGSTDLAWDMDLSGAASGAVVTRGPYLQRGTPTAITVRWRTSVATDSRVRWGSDPAALANVVDVGGSVTEHEVPVSGLAPATRYFYSVGSAAETLAGADSSFTFVTPPATGTRAPTRVWAIGDAGTNTLAQRNVRDAYAAWTGGRETDVWLMLGDNAYSAGTDAEYQAGLFDVYPALLRRTVAWPTRGNHDALYAGADNDYYDIFTLPAAGEAGGVPSRTEAYYAFDRANIHFICLDSEGSDRTSAGAMAEWLRADLAATDADWVIAYWHHPPYTKGSHDSDDPLDSGGRMRDMRESILPILDSTGVDLVLTGHSHSYERSLLLNGHYGTSNTLTGSMKVDAGDGRTGGDGPYAKRTSAQGPFEGSVYVVAGSSGQVSGGALNHPVMVSSLNVLGSLVLDVEGHRLDARFLDATGALRDSFTVLKGNLVNVEGGPLHGPLALATPVPNPHAGPQRFEMSLPRAGHGRLCVYGVDGRRVATLFDGLRPAGRQSVTWSGGDDRGRLVPAGIYFAVLDLEGEKRAARVVRLR